MAEAIGTSISENLMNKEVLEKDLLSKDMLNVIADAYERFITKQEISTEFTRIFYNTCLKKVMKYSTET